MNTGRTSNLQIELKNRSALGTNRRSNLNEFYPMGEEKALRLYVH
jgi:hypothetical protein